MQLTSTNSSIGLIYALKKILSKNIVLNIIYYIKKELIKSESINLIISGGNSPNIFLKSLSNKPFLKRINFYLTDERFVKKKSRFSNYNNLKKILKFSKINSLINLQSKSLKRNFLKSLKKGRKIISVIGIGNDGHFASIFLKSKKIKELINIKEKPTITMVEKIGKPKVRRATVNLSTILLSKKILLLINSKKKMQILAKSLKDDKYPLYYLLKYSKKKLLVFDALSLDRIKFKIK